ncbi:MAG: hypothetical protein E7607_05885 [Ruminococcaceae bacterium]|nr:hypothetical protein [Oscillospiraceae bacterium]
MKKRRIVIVAFILTAAIAIGIGFATLTDTLTIIGNAVVDMGAAGSAFDGKIQFTAAQAVSSTGTGTQADTASFTSDDATFSVHKLAVKDEVSTFKFTIENTSNVPATVVVNATKVSGADNPSNSNEGIFEVTYAYSNVDKVIPSGGTMDVTITVEVIAPVTAEATATFGLELHVTTDDLTP